MKLTILVSKDAQGEWRWAAKSRNNRTIAISGEGYKKRKHCMLMVHRLFGSHVEVTVKEN